MRQFSCVMLLVVIGDFKQIALLDSQPTGDTKDYVSGVNHDSNDRPQPWLSEMKRDLDFIRIELQLQKETIKTLNESVNEMMKNLTAQIRRLVTTRADQQVHRQMIGNNTDKINKTEQCNVSHGINDAVNESNRSLQWTRSKEFQNAASERRTLVSGKQLIRVQFTDGVCVS